MIPVSDNVFLFTRAKPFSTWSLIGLNIALFLYELKLELSGELGYFINTWGVAPAQISNAIASTVSGNAAAGIAVIMRSTSLLTGMFLHGSFAQILGNMLFLWVFGSTLEKVLSSIRFLTLYLIAGILTIIVQIFVEPNLAVPLIGANGAVAACLGAYIYKFPKVKIDSVLPLLVVFIPVEIPAFLYLFWWFIQQLFYGIGSLDIPPNGVNQWSTAYWTHGIGMLFGAVFMRFQRR
ncbi:rhomboid family protein [Calothrix sp. NIES-4071]|nr:rhomboid family protein [Calothrix sp. NIES-4071]BAZ61720.1 rhomboid family protein [Calothrix sp. NIES-4105]